MRSSRMSSCPRWVGWSWPRSFVNNDPTCRSSSPPASAIASSPRERSEEHTSELQSLMRISYAVFCLKKKKKNKKNLYIKPTHEWKTQQWKPLIKQDRYTQ